MTTISNRIKTSENEKIIDAINYLGDFLRDYDIKVYSLFVEENFSSVKNLTEIYDNLVEKLKNLKF